jgi:CRISPR-associated protein Cmr6
MLARRADLQKIKKQASTHAGLWLDKFLEYQTEAGVKDESATKAKALLIKELGAIAVPDKYEQAFLRRKKLFEGLRTSHYAAFATGSVEGRMIIGLGQKGPTEAGLALEHTWGVPMIPGSALKGLTAAAAHQILADPSWHKSQGDKNERGSSLAKLAGNLAHIGEVIFHDAWWIPEGDTLPIHSDVMTVHHQEYYKDGAVPPSDMDSPIPVQFASVTGKYLIVVEKSSPEVKAELLDAALYILKVGLEHLGIGAKTNAGYGRMTLDFECEAERQQREAAEAQAEAARQQQEQEAAQKRAQQKQQEAQQEAQNQLGRVLINNAAQTVPHLLSLFVDADLRREFALQLVNQLTKKVVLGKAKDAKQWALDLLKAAGMEV